MKSTKRRRLIPLNRLHKQAWGLFSKHLRSSAADFNGYANCYTCRKRLHWKELQAGHYIHRRLDFDRRNIHPQCPGCNLFLRGNAGLYAERLATEIGLDGLQVLREDSILRGNLYTRNELGYIIHQLKTCPGTPDLTLDAFKIERWKEAQGI